MKSGPHGAYLRISGGGEPMLHPQATELLVYAKSNGCKIGLITNGSLFDEENSRALLNGRCRPDRVLSRRLRARKPTTSSVRASTSMSSMTTFSRMIRAA